jgi:hypothetical protein
MRKLEAVAASIVVLAGMTSGQQRTDWMTTSNSPDIQYRVQIFENSRACDLEYRDKKQGKSYTTFDVDVDYKSTDSNSDNPHPDIPPPANQATIRTDNEHIVTAPSQNGSARILECSGVVATRVNYLQRH